MGLKHGCTTIKNKSNPKWRAWCAWVALRKRCDNPDKRDYKNYKGRGITYDVSWDDFKNFLADMGLPPKGTSLDRIDNNGNYCKENCRWATKTEQMRNTRHNHYLEYDGKRLMICEWAELLGIKSVLIRNRLRRNWSVERLLSTPRLAVGSNQNVKTIA